MTLNQYFKNILILICLFSFFAHSQSNNDISTLKQKLKIMISDENKTPLLIDISEEYLKKETFDSVILYSEQALKIARKVENIVSAKILSGRANITLGNYKLGRELLESTKDYLIENNDERLFQVYLSIGNSYMSSNVLDKALINFRSAENIAEEEQKAHVYTYLSILYSNTREYEKALDYLNKVSDLALKHGDNIRLAAAYAYFAKLNWDRDQYDEAIEYYNRALKLFKQFNSDYNIAVIENNIAGCYVDMEDLEMAKQHFTTALTYSRKNNYKQLTILIKSNLAKQEILLGQNLKENIELLNALKNSETPIKSKSLICRNYLSLAQGYLKIKDTANALSSLSVALKISKEENFLELSESNLLLLSSINYNNKNYAEAYLNTQEVIKYREEIYNANKNNEIELLRTKFDVNQKENEIKLKEQELSLIKSRTKKNGYLYLSIGLILLFTIITLYRQNKLTEIKRKVLSSENEILNIKKEQLNKEIEIKSYHATNLALDIEDKNKFLRTIKSQVKKVKQNINNKTANTRLQGVILNINDYVKRNEDRLQIILEVDKNNREFYNSLKDKHPTLTDREIKIIGYLRLNMSSQQISNILNINELSLNNIRSRIRKKLNIQRNENFISFLKNNLT